MSRPAAFAPEPAETGESRLLLGRAGQLAAALPVADLARRGIVVGALLTSWISLKPFQSLASADLGDITTGQETLTYAIFGLLAAAALALAIGQHRRALASCLSPATLLLGGWLAVSVVLSRDPGTSAKRLSLTVAVMVLTACLPLLARSRAELRDLIAAAALTLLATCYLGLILAPNLAIHQNTDFMEPALAGNWRGAFGHKNTAAAVMAMLFFIGLGVFRAGGRWSGAVILLLSGIFLAGCGGKSAAALAIVVFGLSALIGRCRSFGLCAALAFGPVLLLNVLSVGTVLSDGLAGLVAKLPIDATFTGRTDIWRFAIDAISAKPVTGYGFAAFWDSQAIRDMAENEGSWAGGGAAHSHNGYVDTTVTLGLVGLVLTVGFLLVAPLRDYQRARTGSREAEPLITMFLQIWLFGMLLSSMESFFFDRADAIWFTFLIAVFGLRYLARFSTR